ncbi:hypothetical protein N658DRAFT_499016 [Parathielavia hyrcaniae]|uniref:Uncharacterized protein n=1 Tax=Parathielavia hyrcaniae TaxID=113614 RepID=A0AAN6PY43_9PEZI|nr:hypothetical protein N658DRAFT_499016 [Parathielavia hyrcaniae]
MATERARCIPRVTATGLLGVRFNWTQVIGRFLSVLLESGTLAFVAWLYAYWRLEPTTRVDVLWPSFFPVIAGILMDTYELVSLLFLKRNWAINPVAVCFDIALVGTGAFCFLLLGLVDRGSGERRASWAADMWNAMVFMIVFAILHAGFIVLAAGGVIRIYFSSNKARREAQLGRSHADIVQFNERRAQLQSLPRVP